MACYDPTPSGREERAAKVLKLIIDFKSLGEEIEYPKGFNGDISGYSIFGSDKYLDEATNILCSFCKLKGDDFIYNGLFKERRRLAEWWDEHKEIDRECGGFLKQLPLTSRVLPMLAQLKTKQQTKLNTMENTEKNDFNANSGNTMLCDGFLIPMTDFVIQQNYTTTLDTSQIDFYDKEFKILSNIRNYAEFLKQPLKLEMFVPCDEEGNILEEPQMRPERNSFDEEDMDYDAQELYDYIKAKEKVLFEGFEFVSKTNETWLFKINGKLPRIVLQKGTVELLRISKDQIKLSQTALDTIFGKTDAYTQLADSKKLRL